MYGTRSRYLPTEFIAHPHLFQYKLSSKMTDGPIISCSVKFYRRYSHEKEKCSRVQPIAKTVYLPSKCWKADHKNG